jgi:hypothetical protein
MSMDIVAHVWQKSQTHGSARTLILTLAIHANECCGVAWASDMTLYSEVNVSRQRIHELKNALEDDGELVIVERPGSTNLYFVAVHGQPLGPQGEYQTTKRGQHDLRCPLRDPALWQRCARLFTPPTSERVNDEPAEVSEISDPPAHHVTDADEGGSEISDPQGSENSDGGGQRSLTQKTTTTKKRKQGAPAAPFVLSPDKPERQNRWWCDAHGFAHGDRLSDRRPDCAREVTP